VPLMFPHLWSVFTALPWTENWMIHHQMTMTITSIEKNARQESISFHLNESKKLISMVRNNTNEKKYKII
jgi:hypothetical protein